MMKGSWQTAEDDLHVVNYFLRTSTTRTKQAPDAELINGVLKVVDLDAVILDADVRDRREVGVLWRLPKVHEGVEEHLLEANVLHVRRRTGASDVATCLLTRSS